MNYTKRKRHFTCKMNQFHHFLPTIFYTKNDFFHSIKMNQPNFTIIHKNNNYTLLSSFLRENLILTASSPSIPYTVNFNSSTPGPMTNDEFKNLFGQGTSNYSSLSIVKNKYDSTNLLSVTINSCQIQSKSAISTFIKLNKGEKLVLTKQKMFLQYQFCFDENFFWGMGGKLPGIGICEPPSGCTPQSESQGASIRLMWRGYDSTTQKYQSSSQTCNQDSNCSRGYLYAYIYHKLGKNTCGDYYNLSLNSPYGYPLEKGKWYFVTFFVNCGTQEKNGMFQIYLSDNEKKPGKLVASCNEIPMIPATQTKDILNWVFLFSVFRGGSTMGWSSDQNSEIYFKFFKMVEKSEELDYPIDFQTDLDQCSYNEDLG